MALFSRTETPLRYATERRTTEAVSSARFSGAGVEHLGYEAWLKDASQDAKVRSGLRRIAEGRL